LVVGHGFVCFERNDELVAVDPATGALLWARDDMPKGIDLFGDARFVFVVSAEGGNEARVLSSLDGREVGRRKLPPRSDWLAAIGRRLLVSELRGQSRRVRLVDVWTGNAAWERECSAQAHVCLVRPGNVAALDSDGRFAAWHAESGQVVMEARLDVPPAVEQVYAEPCGTDLLVLVNSPPEAVGPRVPVHSIAPAVNANGRLFRVARDGSTLWYADILDQQLELDLPSDLPVLLLGKHRREQVPRPQGGMTTKVEYAFQCLDKRTGMTLSEQIVEGHGQEMEIRAVDPRSGRIEVLTRPLSIQITRTKQSP
ncbi:MAG: PQQ-binding-like beta-propeller repeat protein, partial [Patescibacteria group bacterium]|nr:PQQ-binding-like beta-propeller repeat protein [Patescibacteria group bacterium]